MPGNGRSDLHTSIAAADGVVFDVLHMIALPFGALAVAETVFVPPLLVNHHLPLLPGVEPLDSSLALSSARRTPC